MSYVHRAQSVVNEFKLLMTDKWLNEDDWEIDNVCMIYVLCSLHKEYEIIQSHISHILVALGIPSTENLISCLIRLPSPGGVESRPRIFYFSNFAYHEDGGCGHGVGNVRGGCSGRCPQCTISALAILKKSPIHWLASQKNQSIWLIFQIMENSLSPRTQSRMCYLTTCIRSSCNTRHHWPHSQPQLLILVIL